MTEADIADLFAGLGPVSVRRMFGGKGIYFDGVIIAIELRGELMLKADARKRAGFRGGRLQAMDLYRLPARQDWWRCPIGAFPTAPSTIPTR